MFFCFGLVFMVHGGHRVAREFWPTPTCMSNFAYVGSETNSLETKTLKERCLPNQNRNMLERQSLPKLPMAAWTSGICRKALIVFAESDSS